MTFITALQPRSDCNLYWLYLYQVLYLFACFMLNTAKLMYRLKEDILTPLGPWGGIPLVAGLKKA
jgi:hypothetical protein